MAAEKANLSLNGSKLGYRDRIGAGRAIRGCRRPPRHTHTCLLRSPANVDNNVAGKTLVSSFHFLLPLWPLRIALLHH